MRKLLYVILSALLPALAYAAAPDLPSVPTQLPGGGMSFAPPSTDYSVIFLGNIFGMVDGVLFGTGSQIMGAMFGVFNAAVLALGGMIIMYTLMVSTMNTAHEGQFLGQKWSSIWIPVRSTIGLALLIPKASGYCLMQIFVMWVVVQGVGAADKIWETALSYLNRGGVIIRAEPPAAVKSLINGDENAVYYGAYTILAGQVCMLGLQEQLTTVRKAYLAEPKPFSSCETDPVNKEFCAKQIPDFVGSVNFMKADSTEVNMPDFPAGSPFAFLNGICGVVKWDNYTGLSNVCPPGGSNAPGTACGILSANEAETLSRSRSAGLMTMYNSLLPLANVMVRNNPLLGQPPSETQLRLIPFSPIANKGFGVPITAKGNICTTNKSSDTTRKQTPENNCTNWGGVGNGVTGSFIVSGLQFLNAIQSYNGIMAPTLNLQKQLSNMDSAKQSRAFIAEANAQGWMMAGTYFFDLVKLNGSADAVSTLDTNNGMQKSEPFDRTKFFASFSSDTGNAVSCTKTRTKLCEWMGKKPAPLMPVAGMIDGSSYTTVVPKPDFKTMSEITAITDQGSATVNGFVKNAVMIQLPGQAGLEAPDFIKLPSFKIDTDLALLPEVKDFDCGYVFLLGCFGRSIGDFFYNQMLRPIHEFFLRLFGGLIQGVINAFIMVPLTVMSSVFIDGMQVVSQKGVNPVVALSKMGEHYINAAGNMWIKMLTLSISTSMILVIGKFIFALMTMAMPLIIAWLSVMMGVGFITAYYIPMLPYLIFTFASLGWLIAVIEAMVAAPLVALGVTHPEGHDAFGKGEHAVMIIMNVFLRPAMMIIGYIAAISLCYVGVWILNAGFGHAIQYIVGVEVLPNKMAALKPATGSTFGGLVNNFNPDRFDSNIDASFENTRNAYNEKGFDAFLEEYNKDLANRTNEKSRIQGNAYVSWAGIYAFFFALLTYTSAYLTIVQKAFTLIHLLPDKVLRWIGGQPEGIGGETAGWAEESKKQIEAGGEKTSGGQAKIGEKLGAGGDKAVSAVKGAAAGTTSGGESKISKG